MTASHQKGLSLVELVITIAILAIALVGLTSVLGGGLSQSAETLPNVRAVALAQSYLDEILSKRFDEQSRPNGIPPCRASSTRPCSTYRACGDPLAAGLFGPDPLGAGTEDRSRFDDVDDYHCLDEGDGQATALQDAEGSTRSGYDNFRVQVEVRYVDVTPLTGTEANLAQGAELDDQYDAKLVTVSISHRSMSDTIQFSAYKANF